MNKKNIVKLISGIIIAFLFFFLLKYVQYNAKNEILPNENLNKTQQEDSTSEIPQLISIREMPNFTLKNLDGKTVSLKDYRGKIVFLNFWATWCIYCDKEMPDLQELYEGNRDDFVVLAVNVGETKSEAEEYMTKNGYTFPVLLDEKESVASNFRIGGLPTTFFINKDGNQMGFKNVDGNIIDRIPGMMTREQMDWFLKQIRNAENKK